MLNIWYEGRKVGELDSRNRELAVRYAPEWIGNADAFPLSPRLPLAEQEYVGEEPMIFVSNLLPEGPMLSALTKLRKLPRDDVFALIHAFGAEVAGAFSILPPEETPANDGHYETYTRKALCADLEAVRRNVPIVSRHRKVRLSLAGAQNKIAVYVAAGKPNPVDGVLTARGLLMLPEDGAVSSHILKPNIQPDSDYPDSANNEALCLALAGRCGLPAVHGELIEACGERVLLVERYDRALDESGRLRRLHQLDFCQLAGFLPDIKYEDLGGPSLAMVFDLIRKHSAVPSRELLTAVEWVIFNYLVGNADAHAKNLAMMPVGKDKFRIAPWYDILCTGFYPRSTTDMAMKIGGENRPEWVRAGNWARFAKDTDINPSLLRHRFSELGDRMLHVLPQVAPAIGVDPKGKLAVHLSKTIAKRLRWTLRAQEAR